MDERIDKRRDEPKTPREWLEPEIKDFGDLRELTATFSGGDLTDVPIGFPTATTAPGP